MKSQFPKTRAKANTTETKTYDPSRKGRKGPYIDHPKLKSIPSSSRRGKNSTEPA